MNTEQIVVRYPNQKLGNKHFYNRLDFVCPHLPDKRAEGLVKVDQVTEIEPTLDMLYKELQKYDFYMFYIEYRDNNGRTTFGTELTSKKMKRCGYKIDFYIKNGEHNQSEFSILDSVCKIEKKLDEKDFCERYYHESYTFTLYFTGSNTPLKFGVSKTESFKEV